LATPLAARRERRETYTDKAMNDTLGRYRYMDDAFWKGKRVFVTGHTGFKGAWLSLMLQSAGAVVTGYALDPPTNPSLFEAARVGEGMTSIIGDIRDREKLGAALSQAKPDIAFHLAAQALVRLSYQQPIETFETNTMGTLYFCDALRNAQTARAAVVITTDKCYDNKELDEPFAEDQPMGGHDPYSASKGCAELAVASWRASYLAGEGETALATARAGNVIGGGDWAADRLVPDIFRALEEGRAVRIRNPHAIRPWQHVLEPLSGYLTLAERLYREGKAYAEGWNFGPEAGDAQSVEHVVRKVCAWWGEGASWQTDAGEHPHEAQFLRLDITKAKERLGWRPRLNLDAALEATAYWQKSFMQGMDAQKLCLEQIRSFGLQG
jgi:CDP-glucose 4,6-dehydratase